MIGGELLNRKNTSRRLRSWMIDAGLTQEQVAKALNVSVSTVQSWVYCKRPISLDRAIQICDLFGKPLDELACRENK